MKALKVLGWFVAGIIWVVLFNHFLGKSESEYMVIVLPAAMFFILGIFELR